MKILAAPVLAAALAAPFLMFEGQPLAWLRLVDRDGGVTDVQAWAIDRLTRCSDAGPLTAQDGGAGFMRVVINGTPRDVTYQQRFWNEGAITGDPDNTGHQLVLIEATDRLAGDGFEACEVYE